MELTEKIKQELSKDGLKLVRYPKLKNNKEAVLVAVKQNGWALEFASKKLRANKEVVLEAVKESDWVLQYASYDLTEDKDFMLEAVKQNGFAICKRGVER